MTDHKQVKVVIQICSNCKQHSWCTRHNQQTYLVYAKDIERSLLQKDNSFQVSIHPVDGQKIGSFQISCNGILIFSKLKLGYFPHTQAVTTRISQFLQDVRKNNDLSKYQMNYGSPIKQRTTFHGSPTKQSPIKQKMNNSDNVPQSAKLAKIQLKQVSPQKDINLKKQQKPKKQEKLKEAKKDNSKKVKQENKKQQVSAKKTKEDPKQKQQHNSQNKIVHNDIVIPQSLRHQNSHKNVQKKQQKVVQHKQQPVKIQQKHLQKVQTKHEEHIINPIKEQAHKEQNIVAKDKQQKQPQQQYQNQFTQPQVTKQQVTKQQVVKQQVKQIQKVATQKSLKKQQPLPNKQKQVTDKAIQSDDKKVQASKVQAAKVQAPKVQVVKVQAPKSQLRIKSQSHPQQQATVVKYKDFQLQIQKVFKTSNRDVSGMIQKEDFKQLSGWLLKDLQMDISQETKHMFDQYFMKIATNQQGKITYEEFKRICWQCLGDGDDQQNTRTNNPNTNTLQKEDHPAQKEDHPVKTEDHPVKTEDHPVKTEDHPVKTEDHPVKKEDTPPNK